MANLGFVLGRIFILLCLCGPVTVSACSRHWLAYTLQDHFEGPSMNMVPLKFSDSRTVIVENDCISSVALYMGSKLFLTAHGFEGSHCPIYFPVDYEGLLANVTSAEFVLQHVVMAINGRVYLYNTEDFTWRAAKGVESMVTEISSYQCCFSEDPSCMAVSSTVLAYNRGESVSSTRIFFSSDGGYTFTKFTLPSLLKGDVGGVFNMPTLSTLSVLLRNSDDMAYFSYWTSDLNLTSKVFPLKESLAVLSVIQPAGMKGSLVIWTERSLLFSPNDGQVTRPIAVIGNNEFPGPAVTLHGIATTGSSEIAVLTSDKRLFYGRLSMEPVIAEFKTISDISAGMGMKFNTFGELVVILPVEDPAAGCVDFLHCLIIIQQALMSVTPPLASCPVELMSSEFDQRVYYIDVSQSLQLSAVYVPKASAEIFPLVTVTDPHLLAFQAVLYNDGLTSEGDKKYKLNIVLLQQLITEMADPTFSHSLLKGGISTLTVDVLDKGLTCKDMHPLNAFINVGCPPNKHIKVLRNVTVCSKGQFNQETLQNNFTYTISKNTYDPQYLYRQDSAAEDLRVLYSFVDLQCPLLVYVDDPWLPLLELWEGKRFVEFVPADFVMFEVHGMYNYQYQQSARSAGCVSQPQTWRSMLKTQSRPDPHTAWNRKNYVSCKDPSGPPLTSPELEYEVLKAGSGNMVMFPSYNGFYIFKAIVVDPTYSFCELSVTFSVYVYGAFPEAKFDSPLTLVVFLAIFAGIMLVGFYLPWFLLKRPNP
ncbi:cation channel sperm-associated protein subunit delta-like [Acipenser oxyrinchus oxyrinchus]|uniref:Cation channel sperm-associated auxiliary subunit delta n=1 Tax=Acipenser oxyrinchus oxyrinchus TaxID=40147 RepID=A0AAD8CKC1_ACIOX|nr:cation channel sperm-associated protein subunit delta-like [Acipenser oxyrinchus oxyrinchus]